jgi:hypothetical protein
MLRHARGRAFPVRLHHVDLLDFLIAKEAVSRHRL